MITRVRFAAIADESRIILQGACFTWADGTATLVATDTHRLAVDSRPIAGEGEALTCIIPARALDEMARAIGKSEKTVSLHISASQVGLTVEGLLLVSRLIEGQFPDYDRSMRAESPTTITVHPGCLLHAIDRQGVIARAESSKIFLKSGENYIELSAQTGEGGKGRENLPASLTGPSVEAAFNADYLHDVLSVLDTEAVMLGFDGSLRPIMIHGQGIDGYACVVMPMQIL